MNDRATSGMALRPTSGVSLLTVKEPPGELADQAPNDGRLRTRRDNSRPPDHSRSLCRVPGWVQPLPRLIVDGNLGSAGNDLLYVPAVFFSSYLRVRRWWKEP